MTTSGAGFIDVHAHFVTGTYVAAARAAGHERPDGMPGWPEWSAETHLDVMDRSGIDTAMLSVSSPGVHFGDDAAAHRLARQVNEFGAEVVRTHPGRFGLFASLPLPSVDGAIDEIGYAFDVLGADGVIIGTNSGGVYLGDERLEPVWAELDRRGAVVLLHPTSPVCWQQTALGRPSPVIEFLFDTARAVTDMVFAGTLVRHPRLQVVVPHCGGAIPVLADRVNGFLGLLRGRSADTPDAVEQLRRLYYDTAGTPFPRQIPALLGLTEPTQLLYGSDYPWTPAPIAELHTAAFTHAPCPGNTTWRALTTANARRLFPRLAGPPAEES